MMTVDRFSATIELMPLLHGEFRVVSMRLDRPRVQLTIDEDGALDWLARNEASKALDPEKVILENVEIADGRIDYVDKGTGINLSFDSINAVVGARSLSGPWRVEGSYLEEGTAVPFRFATGRRLDDGTIRVRTDLSPAGWPVSVAADGVLGFGEDGMTYDGTYNITEIVPASSIAGEGEGEATGDATGWRSEGKFTLTRHRLVIAQAVLSDGPPERPYSIAGSLTVDLGLEPRFEAHASARQVDLDRSLGEGPRDPVEVAAAIESLVGWLANSFVPPIPGSVFFDVPGIVVGGAVVQNVAFEARPTIGGWRVASFNAELPGHASIEARGVLATDFEVGFAGNVRLVVNQPAIFAKWWRGESDDGSGRLLAPFELSGRAEVAPQRFVFENIDAIVGDAAITGRFGWSAADLRQHRRVLEAELVADRVDFVQLKALAELIAGKDLANSAALADSYAVKLSADTLQFEDVTMSNVAIDASYAEDALTVNEFGIGDLGGASLNVTQGRIDSLSGRPRGHLDAQLEADTLRGLTRVVERALPNHPFSQWLRNAGPSLTPAFVTASIEAPPQDGGADFRVTVGGDAASTSLSAVFDLSGGPGDWRQGGATAEIILDSPDAAELARQTGIATGAPQNPGLAHLQINASGVPATGLETRVAGEFAGVGIRSNGRLALPPDGPPAFGGSLAAASDNLEPIMRMVGLGMPGAAAGTPARIDGRIETRGQSGDLVLNNSQVADRLVAGRMSLARATDGGWQIGGELHVDAVDLGWVTALGLGFGLEPTGEASAPWSKAPFGEPGYGPVTGRIAVLADELLIAQGFDATAASLVLEFQPNRFSAELAGGQVVGGSLSGGLSIHNVGGNVTFTGRFDLKDASLDRLVWRRAGRAVATGTLDLSAEFEGAGRSPAVLASSLTGGGTLAIRNGEVRYVNPQAARLVIRAADLGQEFTENELVEAVTRQIDGGSLTFDRTEGVFSIAAGVARVKSMAVEGEAVGAVGGGVIDFTTLAVDSDWTLSFDPGDDKVEGATPQVGIVFRGPLDAPSRIIDVLQFGSYLNIRQEERLLEILSQAEADRLERERLNRERRKLREDAERRAREAVEAEAARRAAEEEAARIAAEAERRRLAAEAVAREAAEEQALRIAEEAARTAAAEEATRIAAEAERQKREAEDAARQAAEEAARWAAEEEAARIAAESERQRRIAEEAARRAAEEEAAQGAAEAERQRPESEETARREAGAETERAAADLRRARDENSRSARMIAVLAASSAADAAARSTPRRPQRQGANVPTDSGPALPVMPRPTPNPRPKPLLLFEPVVPGEPVPISPPLAQ